MSTPSHTATVALPSTAARSLRLLILLADTPVPGVQALPGSGSTYGHIFTTLFRSSSLLADDGAVGPHELLVESYDTVQELYPTDETLQGADAVLITGSAASAYLDTPWIEKLVEYVGELPKKKEGIKVFGICFGHQIVARAFGSTVEKNEKGWEVGVRNIELTDIGKALFNGQELTIHQMHQDHVPALPPSFELLGSTPVCPVQGMVLRKAPSTASEPLKVTDIQIITFQGHPEFTSAIVNELIDLREAKGVFNSELAEQSRLHAKEKDEGVRIGRVLLSVLGV